MKSKYRVCEEVLKTIMKANTKQSMKIRDMRLKRWMRTPEAQKQLFNNDINMYNTFSYYYFKRKL